MQRRLEPSFALGIQDKPAGTTWPLGLKLCSAKMNWDTCTEIQPAITIATLSSYNSQTYTDDTMQSLYNMSGYKTDVDLTRPWCGSQIFCITEFYKVIKSFSCNSFVKLSLL